MRTPSKTASDFDSCRAGNAPAGGTSCSPARTLATAGGSSAPASRRRGVAGVFLLGCLFLLFAAAPAFAANEHTTITGEYEKQGPGTGLGEGGQVAFDPINDYLYLCADARYYRLHRPGHGAADPAGTVDRPGPFSTTCADFDVDDSATASAGNVLSVTYGYFNPSLIHGYDDNLTPLPPPFPFELGGSIGCDIGIANNGDFFVTHQATQTIRRYSSSGSAITTIPFSGGTPCSLDVNPVNNDLLVQCEDCTNRPIYRLTAASGYTTKELVVPSVPGFGGVEMAINGALNKIYLANLGAPEVRSYDLATGSLLEAFAAGGPNIGYPQDVAVDESSDTVFLPVGGYDSGRILEIPGVKVPQATTGNPVGDNELTGTADPNGAGDIASCFFEYGPTSAPGFPSKVNCSDALPITTSEGVSALLPTSLTGGETYRYRLGVATAAPGVDRIGGVKTIKPEWTDNLAPEAPNPLTRISANLKASFTGNGEPTEYKFQWGLASNPGFEFESSYAPVGSPVGPTNIAHLATSLQPEAEYRFRAWVKNGIGVTHSTTLNFETLPKVQNLVTKDATNVAPKSATLNASFEGDGTATTYHFEYGQTPGVYTSSTPEEPAGSPNGAKDIFSNATGLALETTYYYRVVVTNTLGTTNGGEKSFTTKPAVAGVQTLAATDVDADDVTLNGEFQGDGAPTSFYFEYSKDFSFSEKTEEVSAGSPTGTTPVVFELTEYEGFKTYNYRLVAVNSFGETRGATMTFVTPGAGLPGVGPASAEDVGPTSAKLNSTVDPNRWATVYTFEYGPTSSYGSSTVLDTVLDGKGTSPVPVNAVLDGLLPGTTYHFRIVAINLVGTTHGTDQTFQTPGAPLIDSAGVGSVTQAGAQLTGFVTPKSSPTAAHFEYGTSPGLGLSTPETAVGGDESAHAVNASLSGLNPGTTYHFRLVATNAVGSATSTTGTFTTGPASAGGGQPEGTKKRPRKCRKGFVKRKTKSGKVKCVKRKKKSGGRRRG